MASSLWQRFPTINAQLQDLIAYLPTLIKSGNPAIDNRMKNLISSGGKLLRPGFFYMFAQLGQAADPKRLRSAAAAIELLHTATLIHDDVLDNADQRHGQPALQIVTGNRTAIYAGDFLFTSYFTEILKAAETREQIQTANDIMRTILVGELDQLALNFHTDATIRAYLNEIEGKTARLFSFAAGMGVALSHGDKATQTAAESIGLSLGMAYQIRDDILDIIADPTAASKPVRHDLRQGVYTLPLLLASRKEPDWFESALAHPTNLTDQDVITINNKIIALDGPQEAEQQVQTYTSQALKLSQSLPAPIGNQLQHLLTTLLTRKS
ncbi:polyprenyl synthetase family protein [Furfurilactobacillus curtus]|uniref:Heptaprenyl diphosphate synthase n=1 Tax=Furfurilactobacillus curtus TaxID=1746200 RepID=A0ABQ5JTS2_9LACO